MSERSRTVSGQTQAGPASTIAPPAPRKALQPDMLEGADDQTLLATRLCDLPLQLDGTLMARRVKRLHRELQAHDIDTEDDWRVAELKYSYLRSRQS